ncbi:MAG: hypothetical protein IKQ85_06595 [Bacteroidaceae bacterium]|nr:hypothetical protein [Bacteroidaceae bacterium]
MRGGFTLQQAKAYAPASASRCSSKQRPMLQQARADAPASVGTLFSVPTQ